MNSNYSYTRGEREFVTRMQNMKGTSDVLYEVAPESSEVEVKEI